MARSTLLSLSLSLSFSLSLFLFFLFFLFFFFFFYFILYFFFFFFFSSRRRHTRLTCDWSSDVCSSDLDLQHPVLVRAVAEIDAIALGAGGDGAVQIRRRLAGGSRLLSGQAEIADEHRFRRVGQVVHLGHAPHAPAFDSGDEVGDAGVALPPVLVSALQALDDRGEQPRLPRIGHVPDLVRGIAEGAEQVHLALVALGEVRAVAHAHHLRPARFRQSGLAGNVSEVAGFLRIGHIDDRRAVVFLFSRERVEDVVAVVADIGDPAVPLP